MTTEAAPPVPPARRSWRRTALRASLALAVLTVAAGFVLRTVLAHLGEPSIKRRIVGAAASAGVVLDYQEASLPGTGIHISGFQLPQPAPDGAARPLVVVDHIDGEFDAWAAFSGHPKIRTLTIQGIHVVFYADDDGSTSVTRVLSHVPPAPAKPSVAAQPISDLLASLAVLPVAIDSFKVNDVDIVVIRRAAGHEYETIHFAGLEASLTAANGALNLTFATPPAGNQIDVTRDGTRKLLIADARIDLGWKSAPQTPRGDLSVDVKLRQQDFVTMPTHAPPIKQVVSLKASIVPQPANHKTVVTVEKLLLLDGAGTGGMDADLIDDGTGSVKPVFRQASFDLKLDGLPGFVPDVYGELKALAGTVKIKASGVDWSNGIRVATDGGADVEVNLSRLSWSQGESSLELSKVRVEGRAKPVSEGVAIEARVPLEAAHVKMAGRRIDLTRATAKLDAHVTSAYRVTGQFSTAFEALHAEGPQAVDAATGELRVKLNDADFQAEGPFHLSGAVTTEASFQQLTAKASGFGVDVTDVTLLLPLHVRTPTGGSVETHFEAKRLTVQQAGRTLIAPMPAKLDLEVPRFTYDESNPVHSTADAQLDFTLGALTAALHADKKVRDVQYDVSARSGSLGLARPFLRASGGTDPIPWEKIGFTFNSKGQVTNIGPAMQMSHDTSLQVDHGSFSGASFAVGADALTAKFSSHGSTVKHEGDATMHLAGLTILGKARTGEENVKAHFAVDRTLPKAELSFESAGEACPEGHVNLSINYDRARARLAYSTDIDLKRLQLIPEFLPPDLLGDSEVAWEKLAFAIRGQGELDGVVTAFHDMTPVLASNPLKALRGTQSLDVTVKGIDYSNDDDQSVVLPSAHLVLAADEKDDARHFDVSVDAPHAELNTDDFEAKFEGLSPELTVDLGEQTLRAKVHMKIGALTQDAYAAYPIGDAQFDAVVSAAADGTVRLESAKFDNPAGGTTMSATGDAESVLTVSGGLPKPIAAAVRAKAERKGISFSGDVSQHLERLPPSVGVTGTGVLRVPFTVASSDSTFFTATTKVEFQNAVMELVERHITVRGLNARIPIKMSFSRDEEGVTIHGGARAGVYSRERFVDYEPFLGREDFMTCESLQIGDVTVGPIAANLRIDRNLLALDQLQMSAYGGKITGQIIVDTDVTARELLDVQFRGDVTGLAPMHDGVRSAQKVNANAALRLDPKRLELEGRMDIVSIGPEDLLPMLDSWDPYHADSSANRVRAALAVGYPKDVRLGFHQGFTEVNIEMGGVASAAKIEPVRVSTGPVLEKYVVPYLKLLKPKVTP